VDLVDQPRMLLEKLGHALGVSGEDGLHQIQAA